jgi:hypothetical protein
MGRARRRVNLARPPIPAQSKQMTKTVRIFRWIVFLLAAGYCLRTLAFSSFEHFAGPFRYLTIWALFMSFFAASRMMALVEGRSTRRWDGFVGATAVVNAMVVFLYWRLFFADPGSVSSDGELGPLYLELYLHALGPLLQWVDAIFIHRSFRRLGPPLAWLFGIIAAYVAWSELVLMPMNDVPVGTVSSGLPYPFLNNLELSGRAVFFGSNFAVAIVFLLVFAAIAWGVRRIARPPAAP